MGSFSDRVIFYDKKAPSVLPLIRVLAKGGVNHSETGWFTILEMIKWREFRCSRQEPCNGQ